MQNKTLQYFFSQPHQPFFTLGILSAILFMLLFMLSFKGIFAFVITPNTFHSYSLIFPFFTALFLGFLLTTFPRFSQTPALEQRIYLTAFTLLAVGTLLFLVGSFTSIYLLLFANFLILFAQTYVLYIFYLIYKGSPLSELHDQKWIIIGFSAGIVSNLLFMAGLLTQEQLLLTLAKLVGIYLYLTITAFSIAQRMVPFFSHVMIEKNKKLISSLFALLTLHIIFEVLDLKIGFAFLLIAGLLLAKEIYSWKLPFKGAQAILWILHLAVFWLPAALIISAFASLAELIFEKHFLYLGIHLVMLGFLTTILIGFGTRVTLGHSGNQMQIDKLTKILFYMTQIVVYFRALYSFSGSSILFDISMTLWLILFIVWSVKYLPVIVTGKKLHKI
ncbi:MAG: NnrS family protein [Epsilonproteobacteria bacterium]|nr:NnrS family protein [Campylobacterota bacterium]